jgi:Rrf2 family nitric oxide-sensitive transcriptional repressor
LRLTEFTDFGLRALMRLAAEPDRTFTTDEIASEFSISRNHLMKIVQDLAKKGFIITQRGAGGGIRLSRPPEHMKLGHIIRTLEQRHAMVECFRSDGGSCSLTPDCRLRGKLAAARIAFYGELDRSSLADCAYPAPKRAARI